MKRDEVPDEKYKDEHLEAAWTSYQIHHKIQPAKTNV